MEGKIQLQVSFEAQNQVKWLQQPLPSNHSAIQSSNLLAFPSQFSSMLIGGGGVSLFSFSFILSAFTFLPFKLTFFH